MYIEYLKNSILPIHPNLGNIILKYSYFRDEDANKQLIENCRIGSRIGVDDAIGKDNVCYKWDDGFLAACKGGNMEIIKLLYSKREDNKMEGTLIYEGIKNICSGGYVDIFKYYYKVLMELLKDIPDTRMMMKIVSCGNNNDNEILNFYNKDINDFLLVACKSRNLDLIKLLISMGVNDWNGGMKTALNENNTEVAELMITKGANDWSEGLIGACKNNNSSIINLMIEKGANNWNKGLYGACIGGHENIVNMMIEKGANNWNVGLFGASINGNIDIVNMMISRGANIFDACLIQAYNNHHMNIVELLLSRGASTELYQILQNGIRYSSYRNGMIWRGYIIYEI
jgi:ankyrin repeat protein